MTSPQPAPIAEVLRQGLAAKNLSGRALARKAGIDNAAISRLLTGAQAEVTIATARKLAEALDLRVEQLLGGAASEAAAAAGDPAVQLLALEQLRASPLNPRRTFDADAIEELATSIASDGVLQNLVVRPLRGEHGHVVVMDDDSPRPRVCFEIVAGERRFRAIGLLSDRGQWDRQAPRIPCRIVEANDEAHRAIALLENLQRQDVAPLEEAEAFKALRDLDAKRWSTASIASRIGKTQRYVQQRLQLVEKLAPAAREALAEGRITIEQARIMAPAATKVQQQLLKQMGESWSNLDSPTRLREVLTRNKIPASRAIFPLDEYIGDRLELEDGVYLCDREEFDRLQKRAAEIKVGELRTRWQWAELVEGWFRYGEYEEQRSQVRGKAGAIVLLTWNGEVEVHEGLVKRKERTTSKVERERLEAEDSAAAAAWQAKRQAADQAEAEFRTGLTTEMEKAAGPNRVLLYSVLLAARDDERAALLQLPAERLGTSADLWQALSADLTYQSLAKLAPAIAAWGLWAQAQYGDESPGAVLAPVAGHYKLELPAHLAEPAEADAGDHAAEPAGDERQVDLEEAIADREAAQ